MTTISSPSPPPETAIIERPTLASSFLTDEDLDGILPRVISSNDNQHIPNKTEYLTTGLKSLDKAALDGGLEPRCVVEIVGAGVGGGLSEAAVVDTTGNFDVLGLYALLVARLKGLEKGEVEAMAAKMLDRVKIMRVFDFEGVKEAVREIVMEVEGQSRKKIEEKKERDELRVVEEAPAAGKEEKPKRTYVADSEDEDDEEEEMLFESETKDISEKDTTAMEKQTQSVPSGMQTEAITEIDTPSALKFILVDNLTQVVSPLLKNDLTLGTLQTTSLLSSLLTVTRTRALHTILITPTAPPHPASSTRPVPATETPQQEKEIPPSLSIFSSNKAVGMPALSAQIGLFVDVQLMVSRVPKRRGDARLYYSDESGTGRRRGEVVGVLEVVKDRFGTRTGAWGVFGERDGGIYEV
ncbi:uncharacterized protein yc1106_05812 [Curvularia clavata]|uniref:DNA recombination and repair protein Rad51-like C-terminal domain-containing protein n=1 Tax=Curvularia clavata TaxID=95742 RepID=A0A9Q8ZD36_CURCL|nr:uncharacterized protein yc1106_05812 [Curvularia clavata]